MFAARPCPAAILGRTRNAKALVGAAEKVGAHHKVTLACSAAGEFSIQVRVQTGDQHVAALWTGFDITVGLSFEGGWAAPPYRKLNYADVKHIVAGTAPVPTPKAEAELQLEANQHLLAIRGLAPIAWPTGVIRKGTKDRACKGKVKNPDWPGYLQCSNFTAADDEPICREGCTAGVIMDGTIEPPKPSKSKDKKKETTGDLT